MIDLIYKFLILLEFVIFGGIITFMSYIIPKWHFRLLKKMFPKKLKDVNSYFSFSLPWNYYKIDKIYSLFPFIFFLIPDRKIPEAAKPYHKKLKKVMLILIVLIALFIIIGFGANYLS